MRFGNYCRLHDDDFDDPRLGLVSDAAEATWLRLRRVVDLHGEVAENYRSLNAKCAALSRAGQRTDEEFRKLIDELVSVGLLVRWEQDGRRYLHYWGFADRQEHIAPNGKVQPMPRYTPIPRIDFGDEVELPAEASTNCSLSYRSGETKQSKASKRSKSSSESNATSRSIAAAEVSDETDGSAERAVGVGETKQSKASSASSVQKKIQEKTIQENTSLSMRGDSSESGEHADGLEASPPGEREIVASPGTRGDPIQVRTTKSAYDVTEAELADMRRRHPELTRGAIFAALRELANKQNIDPDQYVRSPEKTLGLIESFLNHARPAPTQRPEKPPDKKLVTLEEIEADDRLMAEQWAAKRAKTLEENQTKQEGGTP